MRLKVSIAAAGALALAASARASSPIPSNYVDDFGVPDASAPVEDGAPSSGDAVSTPTMTPRERPGEPSAAPMYVPPEPSNYASTHASPVPSNYVDDFGLVNGDREPSEVSAVPGPAGERIARP
jgi:hypothetical protein